MFQIKQTDAGDFQLEADNPSASTSTGTVKVTFASGVDAILGRGTTDTDITFIALRNANGVLAYIYPNSTPDGVTVSTTKP